MPLVFAPLGGPPENPAFGGCGRGQVLRGTRAKGHLCGAGSETPRRRPPPDFFRERADGVLPRVDPPIQEPNISGGEPSPLLIPTWERIRNPPHECIPEGDWTRETGQE